MAAQPAVVQYALEHDFDVAVQIDGDGQHDSRELEALLAPVLAGQADIAVGTRFAGERRYRPSVARRIADSTRAFTVSPVRSGASVVMRCTDNPGTAENVVPTVATRSPRRYSEPQSPT